ncbi:MAG TPA: hypothetical protein PLA65_08005 [Spirochaetota bacterium]|nr:hypothetical protein [Spirochaetota bacterium]HOD15506.1 hypothetical protein [Spirochaetota bacterium]HPG50256.1 hypothetical protein [Spirochaetota bacterium]HPN11989.1 hypothetical protein [Spirochaetota bacterium]
MKQDAPLFPRILAAAILVSALAYGAFYFNYFETPTGDYIGNIRGPVLEYMKGNFPGKNFKFLPLYPLLLSLLTRVNPAESFDPVYVTAIVLNMALLLPYLVLVFLVYRRFLSQKASLAALLFLGVNLYTVYMAINSELEMVLTSLVVLSLYLTMRGSKISYLAAFLTAFTKWDSVFIVPAVMFRDFFYNRKRVLALVLGVLAAGGTAAWLLLSFLGTRGAHPYVSEIAHRGPNIYRYIGDCFLVASGFIQWMATHAWLSDVPLFKWPALALLAIAGIVTVAGIIWGGILIWKDRRKEFAPVFVFLAGFLLIHMVYQNTKDRYVMPILWILVLFMACGLSEGIRPWLARRMDRLPEKAQAIIRLAVITGAGAIYTISLVALARDATAWHFFFALLFTVLAAAITLYGDAKKDTVIKAMVIVLCGVAINLSVYYGVRALDHHGLSRVEFKKAALWFRDNAQPGDKMLTSESNVPMYYSGFGPDRFPMSFFIKGRTVAELVPELAAMKVTHVFVDDFYIRRLPVKDPNAIDRRAWVFQEIRDNGEKSGHFRLVEKFTTKGGIVSYIYEFKP